MRTLTATLTAAMKAPSRVPVLKLQAHNKTCGVERFTFTRLYTGNEPDVPHGAVITGDGSLVRARVSAGTIWVNKVASPGPVSDFTWWVNTGIATAHPIAVTGYGSVVDVFYIQSAPAEVRRQRSIDNGSSWFDTPVLALAPPALLASSRIAAAYAADGTIVVFYIFGTSSAVYWTWWDGAAWTAWALGSVGGASVIQEIATCGPSNSNDWPLALAGTDAPANPRLWRSAFNFAGSTFADAQEAAAYPAGSGYIPKRPYLAEIDGVDHLWFLESFTGVSAYSRVFHARTPPGGNFWAIPSTEPDPFDHTCTEGLAPAVATDYVWLCKPGGVWRSVRTVALADLSSDVLRLCMDEDAQGGRIVAELDNSAGKYATPGTGSLAALTPGCELRLGLGYHTTAGDEYVWTHYFQVDTLAHVLSPSGGTRSVAPAASALLVIEGSLPRTRLGRWSARGPLRWNAGISPGLHDVFEILQQLFARAGIYLGIKTISAIADAFQPDFTIYPGQHGDSAAELLYPQAADPADYSGYGTTHAILSGRHETPAPQVTRIRAEGRAAGAPVLADSFDFPGIEKVGARLAYVFDVNVDSAADALDRGTAYLSEARIAAAGGSITVPANPGQQLYDVVTVTDSRAGLSAAKRRIVGLCLSYDAPKNLYAHTLALGGA